jgi:two-component system phosphate regulon response regulator OmpR
VANEKTHVVIVDDEPDIRETLEEYFELKGYRVSSVENAASMRDLLEREGDIIDLAVVDISMPGEDGLSLTRHIRESSDLPVIILTAFGEPVDRTVGLEMGADDYVAKPVDLRELEARVRAVLRRVRRGASAAPSEGDKSGASVVAMGVCQLDLGSRKLFGGDGAEIPITAMEFDLLNAFAGSPNRVLTRDQLLEQAHNRDWEPFDRSIDIRIARIRRKIEQDPSKPEIIKTVRGAGYIFQSGA